MTPATVPGLLDAMRAAQIIDDREPPPQDEPQDRPWFITLVQGMAGWVSGLLLLLFIGVLLRPDTTGEILTVGIVLTAGAWLLYFIDRNAVFLEQLALAVSMAGQLALASAILEDIHSITVVALTLFALQCAVFVVMPNKVARIVATFFACVAWAYFIRFALWPGRGVDAFFDGDGNLRAPLFGIWTTPASWLLTWAPVIALIITLLVREPRWMASSARVFARPALTGALLGAALAGFSADPLWTALLGSSFAQSQNHPLTLWSLFPLLSIALTLLVAHCAFRLRSFGLLGVAIFAALLRLSLFYYQYGTSLMAKSAIMLVLGVAVLGGGFWLRARAAK